MFLGIAAGSLYLLVKYRSETHIAQMATWLGAGGVLPFRVAMFILLGFVSLADSFGMETVVGAYAAGMAIAMLAGAAQDETLEDRLASIGSGFFVPLFFVVSGVTFNLPLLLSNLSSISQFFIFSLIFIFIRLIPLCLYQRHLPQRDVLAQGLLSSTTLPLVVAITYLGALSGQMHQETATALVGAAIMTVTAFPTLAFWLRAQTNETPASLFILRRTQSIFDFFDPTLSKLMRLID